MAGLKRILKLYGSMTVTSNGESVKWVYDYATDEARIESNMTQDEIKASERAKWKQIANRMEAIKPMKKKVS